MSVAEITYQPSFSPGLWRSESAASPWIGRAELNSSVAAAQLSRALPADRESTLSIEVAAFGTKLIGEIIDVQVENGYRDVIFKSFVDAGVTALLKIRSQPPASGGDALEIKEASLSFQVSEHRPRPLFMVDTLYAMLGLAGVVTISIPNVRLDLTLHFNIRTSELSDLLQRRQLYFGLMVIEKSTGTRFDVPEYISGEEMGAIFFATRAILERNFIWRVNDIVLPTPANEQTLAWFQDLESSRPDQFVYKMEFGPSPEKRVIFGQEVLLGDQKVFIEDGIIENRENVGEALARTDGRIVTVRIKPLSRVGRYILFNGPSLPPSAWDEKIQPFIGLDRMLSQRLTERYLQLMSFVLPELPPEQVYALINPETIAVLAEQARERRKPVDEYLRGLLDQAQDQVAPPQRSDVEFEAAMEGFAEGTEHLTPYSRTYSREDIYFDHD